MSTVHNIRCKGVGDRRMSGHFSLTGYVRYKGQQPLDRLNPGSCGLTWVPRDAVVGGIPQDSP